MKTIERNYRKNPHTARFLQVFHSGIGSNGVNHREGIVTETDEDLLDMVPETEVADLRTGGQARFMEYLIARITRLDPATGEAARTYTDKMTEHGKWTPGREGNASRWIDRMIIKENELARRRPEPAATQEVVDVAPGRYAVEEDGVLKFFHLRYGKANTRWAGFAFLDLQASDDLYPVKDRARKARIIALIAQDTETAARRYGQELGVCGRCGRTLTDEESRAYGIGPVCREK